MAKKSTSSILRIKTADQHPITRETIDCFRRYFEISPYTEEVILCEGFLKEFKDGLFPLRVVDVSTLPAKFSDALEAVDPLGYRLLPHELLFALAEYTAANKEILLAMRPVTYEGHEHLFMLGRSSIRAVRAVGLYTQNISIFPLGGDILFCQPGIQTTD